MIDRRELFFRCTVSNDDFAVFDFFKVKRMQRLPTFEHYVIRAVDDVVDYFATDCFQVFLHPVRAGANFGSVNQTSRVAVTMRRLNLDTAEV